MKYGWIKQQEDRRDFKLSIPNKSLPPKFDLLSKMPPVYNQGDLGSCTANAISTLIHLFDFSFVPSRLMIYYNERMMEGTISQDSGANIRDGIKSINTTGVCHEKDWLYDTTRFTTKPPKKCYDIAKLHESLSYYSVAQTELDIKNALVSGFPITFGFQVKESFENETTAKTGIYVPKGAIVGGHAVVIIGYDDTKKIFLIRNSWGADWGINGYFWMPYKEVLNKSISSDFWVINKMK